MSHGFALVNLTEDRMWVIYRAAYGATRMIREALSLADSETIRTKVLAIIGYDECEVVDRGISDCMKNRRPLSKEAFHEVVRRFDLRHEDSTQQSPGRSSG
jgi:hypothetical protein